MLGGGGGGGGRFGGGGESKRVEGCGGLWVAGNYP